MNTQSLHIGLALVGMFLIGLLCGYQLKPSVNVSVYDEASTRSLPPRRNDASFLPVDIARNPVVASALEETKQWKPLVGAGPFDIYANPKIDGYMILGYHNNDKRLGPYLYTETRDGQKDVTMIGACGEVSVTLNYDAATGKRTRSIFQVNGDGGYLAPTKWIYYDNDADGRFDGMVDCEHGIAYKQEGLLWVEVGRDPAKKR